jgi:hypothetical protein
LTPRRKRQHRCEITRNKIARLFMKHQHYPADEVVPTAERPQRALPSDMDRGEQERRFETFRAEYNEERPREALGQTPPGRHYQPSPRPVSDRLAESEYTEDAAVRSVR